MTKNNKQKLRHMKVLVQTVKAMVAQKPSKSGKVEKREAEMKKFEVDAAHFVHLLAAHIIHCPKVKFQAFCPDEGRQHRKSIESTNQLVKIAVETLASFLKSDRVNVKFDFKKCKFEIATIILAIILVED